MLDKYLYKVYWSGIDDVYVAKVCEFPSLSAHGETHEIALKELKSVVKFVIEDLEKNDEPVPTPLSKRGYSGKLNLRMPKELHKMLSEEAGFQNVSLNQIINHKLALQLGFESFDNYSVRVSGS